MTTVPTFHSTFLQFCDDLEGTFPELSDAIRAFRNSDEESAIKAFRTLWKNRLNAIAVRDGELFMNDVEIIPGVVITPTLWRDVSESTHTAIWNYLSSLALLSAASSSKDEEDSFWDEEDFKKGMEEMMKQLREAAEGSGATASGAGSSFTSPFSEMGGLFEKLKGMAEKMGVGAEGGAMPEFKMPERLLKGHIAKMARELAEEFKPEDFGISPEMLNVNDPAKIFEYLQEIFTKKPDLLMGAAQRIAKKIQAKFQRGEIRREDIISEIEELMKDFSENEAFKNLFGGLDEILRSSAKATGNEGSERRRAVQERLRKKAAEKEAKKQSLVVPRTVDAIAADAAAAALLLEEESAKKKASNKKR